MGRFLLFLAVLTLVACNNGSPDVAKQSTKDQVNKDYHAGRDRTHVRTLQEIAEDNKKAEQDAKVKVAP